MGDKVIATKNSNLENKKGRKKKKSNLNSFLWSIKKIWSKGKKVTGVKMLKI